MHRYPLTIDEPPRGAAAKASAWLRGRRVFLAAMLALAEVVVYLIWRPGAVLATLVAALVLVVAVLAARQVRPGVARDILVIIAGAQALLVVLPLVVGFSIFAGLIIAIALIIVLALVAFRFRV
jgi:hypothetical protein